MLVSKTASLAAFHLPLPVRVCALGGAPAADSLMVTTAAAAAAAAVVVSS